MEVAELSLERLLAPLKHDWVQSFLFPRHNIEYTKQLRHAISRPSVIVDMHFKTLVPLHKNPNRISLNRHYTLLFLSCFTNGSLSLGFEVTHRLLCKSKFSFAPRTVAKTIRDDEKGILLHIVDHTSLGFTEVGYCIQISPGCREHGVMLFKTHLFRHIATSIPSGFDASTMRKAIVYCFYSVETRPCPICGALDAALCGCRFSITNKPYLLDLDRHYRHLKSYEGDFQSAGEVTMFSDGCTMLTGSYFCHMKTKITFDFENSRTLSQWAMCYAVQSQDVNLLKLSMPDAHETEAITDFTYTKGVQDMLLSTATNQDIRPTSAMQSSSNYDYQTHCTGHLVFDENITTIETAKNPATVVHDCSHQTSENQMKTMRKGREADIAIASMNNFSGTSTGGLKASSSTTLDNRSLSGSCNINISSTRRQQCASTTLEATQEVCVISPKARHLPIGIVRNNVEETDKKTVEQKVGILQVKKGNAPLQLAPAPSVYDETNSHGTGVVIVDERNRKLEIRKMKNREAAHRSNIKKKLRMQKLRQDINSAWSEETQLVAKKKNLQEENQLLKMILRNNPEIP